MCYELAYIDVPSPTVWDQKHWDQVMSNLRKGQIAISSKNAKVEKPTIKTIDETICSESLLEMPQIVNEALEETSEYVVRKSYE